MHRKFLKQWISILTVVFCIAFTAPVLGAVRNTDVTSASDGNVLFAIDGTFSSSGKEAALKRINEIRMEACKEGVKNPATGKPLTKADYVPMKWSSDLEWIAQTRAAEASISQDHVRPNGLICFSVMHNNVTSYAENLAWNWNGMSSGIEQWYEEKSDWVKQNAGAVTGHYTSLINPKYQSVGLGSFQLSTGGWIATAGEFSFASGLKEDEIGVIGKYTQILEVPQSVVAISLPKSISIGKGATKKEKLKAVASYTGIWGEPLNFAGSIAKDITWTSSNPQIVSVDDSGKITARNYGTSVITAEVAGKKAHMTITVAYAIKYNLNGGKNNKANTNCYTKKITLKNPTKKQYAFAGWYSDSNYKTKVTTLTGGDYTVYAKWTKVTVGKGKTPKLKKVSKGKWKISYAAVSKVSGYQIQYSTNKNFKKSVKTIYIKGKSKTVKLSAGKKYYIRIRAYKLDSTGGKVFGKWSNVKSKKV